MWSTLVHVSVLRIMDALIDISLFDCLHMEEEENGGGEGRGRKGGGEREEGIVRWPGYMLCR